MDDAGITRDAPQGRVARNRRRRAAQFLDAAQRIVTEEGFDALTLGRLSTEVDAAISSVYHYYPSKGHLVRALQADAIGRLTESHDLSVDPVVVEVGRRLRADDHLIRLVVLGRWFVAAADALPQDIRLLQMIMAQRNSNLDPEGGAVVLPPIMALLERVVAALDAAASAGVVQPVDPLARAIMWAAALGGVLEADDLERYVPGVLGGGRLARQVSLDLLVGWGADATEVARIDRAIDRVAEKLPLARTSTSAAPAEASSGAE